MLVMLVARAAVATISTPPCDPGRAHCLAIQLHVATAVPAEWITTQLAQANRQFEPLGVAFQLAGVDDRTAERVANRRDRDALASARRGPPAIDVFITGELDNIDDAGIIYGVTWHVDDDHKYIIVSTQARELTLAHELGHLFGLPHSTYPGSLMNKTERDTTPDAERAFVAEELAAMRPVLRRLLREHVIADVTPATAQ
jgi:hypothetical protein